ncbi:histidine kinase [Thauera phenolivorans]|uniref:histidine kinase n=1 Tax=Thauera phenolivorans TaxID=1792543 RepID=UPI000ACAA832|nr:histidine kinase [Thauera phenolivorans]
MFQSPLHFLARRSILLLVVLAMLALALISLGGMSASVLVAETVQGNASALNAAGGLRRLAHRLGSLAAADLLGAGEDAPPLPQAIEHFERQLAHASIRRVIERSPQGRFATAYRNVEAGWRQGLRPRLEAVAAARGAPSGERLEAVRAEIEGFVGELDALARVIEEGTERRIERLRATLGIAIVLTLVVILVVLLMLQRALHRPLAELGAAAERMARGDFDARARHTGHDELGRLGVVFNHMAEELSQAYGGLEARVAAKTAELQRSDRVLALQEERSAIARELHDSLAQALSYMKIQASRLQSVVGDPARCAEAEPILAELREGINEAYRQLRELLVSFRLRLSADLPTLMADAAREYASRGGISVALEVDLGACRLCPNQEVHVLQIVREALANMVRHAGARRARVDLRGADDGEVRLTVEDDGSGIGAPPADPSNHHGLAIMRERARSMGGEIEIVSAAPRGTCIRVCFRAASAAAPAPCDAGGARP